MKRVSQSLLFLDVKKFTKPISVVVPDEASPVDVKPLITPSNQIDI